MGLHGFLQKDPQSLTIRASERLFYFLCREIGRGGTVKKRQRSQTLKFMRSLYTEEMGFFIWQALELLIFVGHGTRGYPTKQVVIGDTEFSATLAGSSDLPVCPPVWTRGFLTLLKFWHVFTQLAEWSYSFFGVEHIKSLSYCELLRHNLPRHLCQAISQVHFGQKQWSPSLWFTANTKQNNPKSLYWHGHGSWGGGGMRQCRLCSCAAVPIKTLLGRHSWPYWSYSKCSL